MGWLEKLNQLKKESGMTTDDIVAASGLPKGTLNKIFAGATKDPQLSTVRAIVHCLGYTLDDLDDLSENARSKKSEPRFSLLEIEHIKKYRALNEHGKKMVDLVLDEEYEYCNPKIKLITRPYYSIPVSAGFGNPLDDSPEEELEIEDTIEHRKGDFIVKISGDSMKPNYNNGDLVLVQKQPTIEIGEIGIFVLNGESYIKKLGVNELISLNAKYLPKPYTAADSILCCGKVICKL